MVLVCSCNQTLPYQDKSLSAEERAKDIVSRMTLEEKASLMQNSSPAIERLGIKQYNWWSEALHGVARNGTATVFPQTIGMAASFDDDLLHDVFKAVSDEARAKNRQARESGSREIYQGLTFWTPNINIFRDPRWGRGQETYGEDPYLTGRMGVAVVHGLQGPDTNPYRKTYACAKHYAVHSGPEWNRHQFNAEDIDPRDLWETYLPAFKDLVIKGDVQQVMCAYNRYESDPCCGSNKLLTQILRNEWGYKGVVVSDCGAIDDFFVKGRHETYSDAATASAVAVLSGTDVECGNAFRSLPDAVRQGLIKEEDIDVSITRLMKARFDLGEIDEDTPWDDIPFSTIASNEHKALALKMAHESIVLLQNKNDILPLKEGQKVAVIGANANDSVMQWANYNGFPKHTETLVSALKKRISAQNLIIGSDSSLVDAKANPSLQQVLNSVKDADVIIYAGGISPRLEGEEMPVSVEGFKGGDRTDIQLPAAQRNIIKALKDAGKKVVFVNFSGSAIGLLPETKNCEAIVQAWYPGQEGGTALADVLLGDYNPSGCLPVTFYADTLQLPDFQEYSMKGRTYRYMEAKPVFSFGFGLSYTTFKYSNARVQDGQLLVDVKNTGKRDGDEVVQLYLQRPDDKQGPKKALRGFKRVNIAAGQTATVAIPLTEETFEWWDTASNTMRPLKGTYNLLCGSSSDDEQMLTLPYQYN